MSMAHGTSARNTPMVVATPRPPLEAREHGEHVAQDGGHAGDQRRPLGAAGKRRGGDPLPAPGHGERALGRVEH